MRRLEGMPAVQVVGVCAGPFAAKARKDLRRDLELHQGEVEFVQQCVDLRQCEAVLHDVEQEVAAAAGAIEVAQGGQAFLQAAIAGAQNFMPARPDSGRRRRIAAFGDVCAGGYDGAAGDLAVKRNFEDAVRMQERGEHA